MLYTQLRDGMREKIFVLVVDDDVSAKEGLSELLHTKGYTVLQAENGQIALDILKKMPRLPCLIVLDLAMPVMDGRAFLKVRVRDPIIRDIPVVVVSGNVQGGVPLEGIDAYLRKPVKVERLIEVIDQHRSG
jgi:CheY-like chemotaxis protein